MTVKMHERITYPCGTKRELDIEVTDDHTPVDIPDTAECVLHGKDCKAPQPIIWVQPTTPPFMPTPLPPSPPTPWWQPAGCTCGRMWLGVTPPPPCPVHGAFLPAQVWCGTVTLPASRLDFTGSTPR